MFQRAVFGQTVKDLVLKEPRVGEPQGLIDTQGQDFRIGFHAVAFDVPEMLGARHQTDLGHMGARCAEQVHRDRDDHTGADASLDPEAKGQKDRRQNSGEIGAVVRPCVFQDRQIDQTQNRHDDRRSQRRRRQEVDQRGQRKGRDGQTDGGEGTGSGRFRACVIVHDRTRKATCHRITAGKGRTDVGRTQTDQFLIRIDALAFLGGQGLRDRDRFNKADDGDQRGRQQQLLQQIRRQRRHGQRRQALRDGPHNFHAAFVQTEQRHGQGGDSHSGHGASLGQNTGHTVGQAKLDQRVFHAQTHPEQEGNRNDADHKGDHVGVAHMRPQRMHDFRQGMTRRGHTEDVFQLADRDQDTGCGDKARDHGMAEEVRHKAQTEDPHRQQHQTRQERKAQRGGGIADGALFGDLTDGSSSHQRHNRHRPHGQRARCAEDRIEQDRHDRGVKTRLGRQSCQHRIGQRLRDQHDRHDDRGDHIIRERSFVIAAAPVEDRKVSAEVRHGQSIQEKGAA